MQTKDNNKLCDLANLTNVYNSDNIHHYMVDKYTQNKHTKGTLSKQRIIILISGAWQVRNNMTMVKTALTLNANGLFPSSLYRTAYPVHDRFSQPHRFFFAFYPPYASVLGDINPFQTIRKTTRCRFFGVQWTQVRVATFHCFVTGIYETFVAADSKEM